MYFCYIDESGGFEAPNSRPDATPLFVVAGIIVPADNIAALTADFLALNRRFFPGRASQHLDYVLNEVKGALLRRNARSGRRRERRHAIQVLSGVVDLIEKHDARLLGRIWIKEPTEPLRSRPTYTFSIQDIARHFNRFLEERDSDGIILCDSRDHNQDIQVAHSLFTRKHKASGDELPRLVEPVVFGKSDNHVGLQVADIVASGLLFPIAARVYCSESTSSAHSHPRFDDLRYRYAGRLRSRLFLYQDIGGKTRGGVTVSDGLGGKPSGLLLRLGAQAARTSQN